MSKTYDKYSKLIKLGRFTEQELISFRKAVNGSSKLDPVDSQFLVNRFCIKADKVGIKLTKEQQVKGIEWLRRSTYKLNGQVRKNAPLGYFEQGVIDQFKSFKCVGLYDLSQNAYRQYVPIYRCIARDGSYFDYACMMWGEIKVLEVGKGLHSISRYGQSGFELARSGRQSDRV